MGDVIEYVTEDLLWSRDCNDEFMLRLREQLLGTPIPTFEEAVCMLGFFCAFSVGCARLGLKELSKIYSRRAEMYVLFLTKVGYRCSRTYRSGFTSSFGLDRIIEYVDWKLKLYD